MASNHILITGAAGFIGQELTTALLNADSKTHLTITDIIAPAIPGESQASSSRITSVKSDLTTSSSVESLLSSQQKWSAIYLLHGIMSGGAEADLELGLRVNLDSHRNILDHLRRNFPGTVVVFPSSLAVYGPSKPGERTSELTVPLPQSSYGAEKLIVETLLNDYSRRGLLDGRIVRLPTVVVRPGKPSAAASSFASGIIRESLKGEKNILPVSKDLELWVSSPKTVVKNLVTLKDAPANAFGGLSRVVNLPGITVKVGQMLDALKVVGGEKALSQIEEKPDEKIEKIVGSWPAHFDITKATGMGLAGDQDISKTVQDFADSLAK